MQIAIQSMFRMPIVDLATSSFILFTAIVQEKNQSCRRRLHEPSRTFEKTYAWIPAARWTKLLKTNPKGQTGQRKEVTVSQDNRIRMQKNH